MLYLFYFFLSFESNNIFIQLNNTGFVSKSCVSESAESERQIIIQKVRHNDAFLSLLLLLRSIEDASLYPKIYWYKIFLDDYTRYILISFFPT